MISFVWIKQMNAYLYNIYRIGMIFKTHACISDKIWQTYNVIRFRAQMFWNATMIF